MHMCCTGANCQAAASAKLQVHGMMLLEAMLLH